MGDNIIDDKQTISCTHLKNLSLIIIASLEQAGHVWIGCDISKDMLNVSQERLAGDSSGAGDVFQLDMGMGLPMRAGVFDGVIRYNIDASILCILYIFV